ncbi:SurA N-terminal domain-containing protein [Bacteroidia bacterium]|nr:SurA N-terminal domain-containing protein [Bacteroidia bacterium]MDB4107047.1 SurA N-terminal domain-containing protein [Bacteroidia bacterium]MDC1395733.1 SurA N-terminal domain-containing protein [Bacteroidia bacterium]
MSDKYNKEEPSLLQKIQNKTGCLFLVIGVAMLAFVLTDLVGSGSSIFGGGNANSIGSIGEEQVSYEEFNAAYEGLKAQVQQNNPGFQFNEDLATQYRQQAWSTLIEQKTMTPQYDMIGVSVSPAELEDLTIGQNTHQQIQQSFRDPETNQFDKNRLIRFLKEDINNNEQALQSWTSFQKQFTSSLVAQKYNSLIASSFYATGLEARTQSKERNGTVNASIVALPYNKSNDETITVSDADILAYAKDNRAKYEQKASKNIEYVKLNVVPSSEDSANMMNWAIDAKERFAATKDDSAFVSLMNSESLFDPTFRGRGTFSPEIEELLFNSSVGEVSGPFQMNGVYSLFKVTGTGVDTTGNKTIQVAVLDQAIYASTATDGKYYSLAGQVLTKVNGEKSFEEVVEELGLPKGVASKITEKERTISGIPNASKVARWLFAPETEEGDISDIIDLNGSYVVARVSKVNEEGLPTADDLRSEVETYVRNGKIAETLALKMKEALASATSAENLATALDAVVSPVPAASFKGGSLPYVGSDGAVSGAIFGTPAGAHSDVIQGRSALAVVYVNNENEYQTDDLGAVKQQISTELKQTAQNSIREALEEKSKVKDLRYKFYD